MMMKLTQRQLRSIVQEEAKRLSEASRPIPPSAARGPEQLLDEVFSAEEALSWLQDNTVPYRGVDPERAYARIEDVLDQVTRYLTNLARAEKKAAKPARKK